LRGVEEYLGDIAATISLLPKRRIMAVIGALHAARLASRSIFVMGNGGSSATASHFACDLAKGTIAPGLPRVKAIALTDNVPLLTAWANDTAYENIFAGQLVNLANPGDVVIGISGSGNSQNVLTAMKAGREIGAATIGFTGFDGGELKNLVDIAIIVPNNCMEKVEDVHLVLVHTICTVLREQAQEHRDHLLQHRRNLPLLDSPIQQALRSLAQELTRNLQVTMCQILLLDEARETLIVWCSCPIRFLSTVPATGERLCLTEAAEHARALHSRKPVVLRKDHPTDMADPCAPAATATDGFASVGLVPLEVGKEVWGLVSLNEMRSWERSPITSEKIDMCRQLVRDTGLTVQQTGAVATQPLDRVVVAEEHTR
jgi:D-sedoheptulose 7-phosphate isomerase